MPDVTVEQMRHLRMRAERLNATLVEDLKPFLHNRDKLTFRRLPTSPSALDDVSVTTTSTCLMALASSGELARFSGTTDWDPMKCFDRVVRYRSWASSGLLPGNAFTSTLVLRAFGYLQHCGVLTPDGLAKFTHKEVPKTRDHKDKAFTLSLERIIHDRSLHTSSRASGELLPGLRMGEYPVAAPVVYWFVDAVNRASHSLKPKEWGRLVSWASGEYARQVSLTAAQHDALKDPIAMAMAACLCSLLRRIAKESSSSADEALLEELPSSVELKSTIRILFGLQEKSGIWPKYFPLFHYPDAGANYCFTFELLEAILQEFGGDDHNIVCEVEILSGLEKAVAWCEQNRLSYQVDCKTYCGWNSGGQIATLQAGEPESWATGTVHMFLCQLREVLSRAIRQQVLDKYSAYRPDLKRPTGVAPLDKLLDVPLVFPTEGARASTVRDELRREIIEPARLCDRGESALSRVRLHGRVSALLFGPPGTSKTSIGKAVAEELGWPFVLIDPSHFLDKGLENIYIRANEIFDDFMDLPRTVLFFDEMDALVQTREDQPNAASLDATSRFLTTSMLPKLARLHDTKRTVFVMATNHQASFDPAIKRPGRFDLLLCVGTPGWSEKVRRLDAVLSGIENIGDIRRVQRLLRTYVSRKSHIELLDRFTFGEIRTFLSRLSQMPCCRGAATIEVALRNAGKDGLLALVESFSEVMTLHADSDALKTFEKDRQFSRIQ